MHIKPYGLRRRIFTGLAGLAWISSGLVSCGGQSGEVRAAAASSPSAAASMIYPDRAQVHVVGLPSPSSEHGEAWGPGPGYRYSITPPLPEGLQFDALSGRVFGTPKGQASRTLHRITAASGARRDRPLQAQLAIQVAELTHTLICLYDESSQAGEGTVSSHLTRGEDLGIQSINALEGVRSAMFHPRRPWLYSIAPDGRALTMRTLEPNGLWLDVDVRFELERPADQLAFDAGGSVLYTADKQTGALCSYSLSSSDGTPTLRGQAQGQAGQNVLAIHPRSSSLYSVNARLGRLDVHRLSPEGYLMGGQAHRVNFDGAVVPQVAMGPLGDELFVVKRESSALLRLALDPTMGGARQLTHVENASPGALSLAISPDGETLFVTGSQAPDQRGTLDVFRKDPESSLPIKDSTHLTGRSPIDVSTTPDGQSLVVLCSASQSLVVYALGAEVQEIGSGQTRELPLRVIYPQLAPPASSAVEYAYAATAGTDELWTLALRRGDNAWAPLGAPLRLGSEPTSVTLEPRGRFLYAVLPMEGALGIWRVLGDGAILEEALPRIPTAGTPEALCVDPSGRYLFALLPDLGMLTSYGIDRSTGHLTSLGQVRVGAGARGMTMDPSGTFLYISTGQGLSTMRLRSRDGALHPVPTPAG